MRLKAKGFVRNRRVGFVFPGIDPTKIRSALKKKRENKKNEVVAEEPKMNIGPIASNGSIGVDFNTEMIAPSAIN